MMTRANYLKLLFTALLAGLVAVTVGVPIASAGTATAVNTSSISEQVRHNLAMLPWYGVFDNLQFQVNGTEVVLSGEVISEHGITKDDAANAVKKIPGVTNVVNNIEILPPSPFDNEIRRAEYRAIFSKSDLGRYTLGVIPQVHIIVKGGHVTLEGKVIDQMDRTVAGIAANSVPGVFSVQNNLQVG
jgi:hyperosmotically inducible periplasmic protein